MFLRFKRKASPVKDLPDAELILQYRREKDPEIIAVLFQRYTHLVYGVCLNYLEDRDEARDAVMEIFEGLIDSLLRHDVENFKSWLHAVARNHCLMKLRKARTVPIDADKIHEKTGGIFMENEEEPHPETEWSRYTPDELESALKTLREPQRRCIELVYLKDKSYREACEITGYSMNEVKSHVQNGKRNLKIRLEELHAGKS